MIQELLIVNLSLGKLFGTYTYRLWEYFYMNHAIMYVYDNRVLDHAKAFPGKVCTADILLDSN